MNFIAVISIVRIILYVLIFTFDAFTKDLEKRNRKERKGKIIDLGIIKDNRKDEEGGGGNSIEQKYKGTSALFLLSLMLLSRRDSRVRG